MTNYHVGIEMGGTGCKVAIFDTDMKKISQQNFPTTLPTETIEALSNYIKSIVKTQDTFTIGIACFGPLQLKKTASDYGSITTTPKPGWKNTPVVKLFSKALTEYGKLNIAIDTDVNVCALYEYKYMNEKLSRHVTSLCYVTVGTGVGIGLVINNKCVHGLVHPEGGHAFVGRHKDDISKYPDFNGVCPYHGDCIEGLSSNNAIKTRLGLKHVDDAINLPDDHEVWDFIADSIGTLCSNIFLCTSVEHFSIGGGIYNRAVLLKKTRRVFEKRMNKYIDNEKINTSEKIDEFITRPILDNDAGIYAAAYYGKSAG